MFDYIKGSIQSINEDSLVIDIGNIGFKVGVAFPSSFNVGDKACFYLYMHCSQDNAPLFYGFISAEERIVFLLVISCSGVGPKIGLSVLEDIGLQGFLEAVQVGDESAMSKVSGIGPKKAEQMIVQLKHKVNKLIKSGFVYTPSGGASHIQEVSDVLSSLNYSRSEINSAINHLKDRRIEKRITFDQLMRQALAFLASR